MQLDPRELEKRLRDWADEYAGGRYENIGWSGQSWLATMIKYRGGAPQGLGEVVYLNTDADKVEEAVAALETTRDGYKPGRVVRAEYWMSHAPEEQKLQALRQLGLPMSRAGYYLYLKQAKIHVAAWLRIPLSEAA